MLDFLALPRQLVVAGISCLFRSNAGVSTVGLTQSRQIFISFEESDFLTRLRGQITLEPYSLSKKQVRVVSVCCYSATTG